MCPEPSQLTWATKFKPDFVSSERLVLGMRRVHGGRRRLAEGRRPPTPPSSASVTRRANASAHGDETGYKKFQQS